MRAVLPADTKLIPVGGISANNMNEYLQAGANGFGIGSSLFKPGISVFELGLAAELFVGQVKKS